LTSSEDADSDLPEPTESLVMWLIRMISTADHRGILMTCATIIALEKEEGLSYTRDEGCMNHLRKLYAEALDRRKKQEQEEDDGSGAGWDVKSPLSREVLLTAIDQVHDKPKEESPKQLEFDGWEDNEYDQDDTFE
jgi:hypothetical protein